MQGKIEKIKDNSCLAHQGRHCLGYFGSKMD